MLHGMRCDARHTAQRYYSGSGRSLEADVAALLRNPGGVVHYGPELVALVNPVLHHSPQSWEQLEACPPGADAWHVHLLVGDMARAYAWADALPALPLLCFRRGLRSARPHVQPWQRFLMLIKHTHQN